MSDFKCIDLSEPKYFSMIPYVIHEIGLDVYEIAVYAAIKRSAGEKGDCTKSKNTLAKQSGNISTRKLVQVIHSLCKVNPFLKKQLIICQKRDHEYGDSDTNLLKVVDIWIENIALCKENERGGAKLTLGGAPHSPPHAPYSPQGVHAIQGGGAPHAPKEKPFKKNPYKKKLLPLPPSKGAVVDVVVVHKNKITEAEREAAASLKDWLDKEAYKDRQRKKDRYNTDPWGMDWIIPLELYEKFIRKFGIKYFDAQLRYMHMYQIKFDQGKNKKGVENPEAFLQTACKGNYAQFEDEKE